MPGSEHDHDLAFATPKGQVFNTTHWSVVLEAGHSSAPGAQDALEKLCRTYWHPIYAFVRHQGNTPDSASDLTQEFFARFLEKKHIKLADPARGRFRSFLIASLKAFLINEWQKAQTEKRGGGCSVVSLDELAAAEVRLTALPADPSATPDQVYEKQWALTLLDQVLSELRAEYTKSGKIEQFDALKDHLWGEGSASQAEIATRLGNTQNAVGVSLHRLRRRFGEVLREFIAQTVSDPAEIDAELRHLIGVMAS